jgi:hypothetical protein
MKENELVRNMYSRLNLVINELNSIRINKVGGANIVWKIISLLPQKDMGASSPSFIILKTSAK